MAIYELTSENLTNVGSAMGSAQSFTNFRKPFSTLKKAQDYAEQDYGKQLAWIHPSQDVWQTKDLGYVMYRINRIEVE